MNFCFGKYALIGPLGIASILTTFGKGTSLTVTNFQVTTVLPLIIPAGIINFDLFPAGIIRGRELLEVLKMYFLSLHKKKALLCPIEPPF